MNPSTTNGHASPRPAPQRRGVLLAGLGAVLAAAGPGRARASVVVEGHTLAERIRLIDSELVLNGNGVRAVAWFKGYAAGLYLPRRAGDAQAVQGLPGPKRLHMVMLQEAPAAKFSKAFDKGVSRDTEAAKLEALRPRMAQFARAIDEGGQVRRGTVLPGEDFYRSLLRSFVGARPFDERLRAGLLGQR